MIALLFRALVDVRLASHLGALLAGEPQMGPQLAAIAHRESRQDMTGPHVGDQWASRLMWRNAVRTGWLNPQQCRYHALDAGPWSPSGSWGMSRAYSVRWLPGCWPAWLIDVPIVGAIVAVRRATSSSCASHRRCRSWRGW